MSAKILVVDDEQDMVDLLCYNLKAQGYEVFVARNGVQALAMARRLLPDLLLLDLMLEGLDGFTVCEVLRRDSSTAHVPIIMLTALTGQMARASGLASGADDFVSKPFRVGDLLGRVAAALQVRRPGAQPGARPAKERRPR